MSGSPASKHPPSGEPSPGDLQSPAAAPRPPARLVGLAVGVAVSGALAAVSLGAGWIDPGTIEQLVDQPGPVAMLAYVAVVFGVEVLWFPRMWGLLVGGLVFGPWRGAALSIVADMLSAAFCFGLARGTGRAWVQQRLRRHPRAEALIRMLAHERGLVTVSLLRILPVHFTAASYAAGLAGVSWRSFLLGTLVGVVPGALVFNFVGDAVRTPGSPAFAVGIGVLILFVLGGAVWIRRLWKSHGALGAQQRDGAGHDCEAD